MKYNNEQIKKIIEEKYNNVIVNIENYSPASFCNHLHHYTFDVEDEIGKVMAKILKIVKLSSVNEKITIGFQLTSTKKTTKKDQFSAAVNVSYAGSINEYEAVFDSDTGFEKLIYSKHLAHQVKTSKSVEANIESPDGQSPKILIADDNKVAQIIQVKYVSTIFNVSPKIFKDGKAAMAAAFEQEFQILLIDNQMPEIRGIEVAKAIKTNREAKSHSALICLFTADEALTPQELKWVDYFFKKPLHRDFIIKIKETFYEAKDKSEMKRIISSL